MNMPKVRLTKTAGMILLLIVMSVFIWFTVDTTWSETSPFSKVRFTLILGLWLFGSLAIMSVALVFFKSSRVTHGDGSFTWAKRDIDKIELRHKKGSRSLLLPFYLIPHDGFRAMFIDQPGKGEHGGWECVVDLPGILEDLGDNLVIHSLDRTVYIGEESHDGLGGIYEEILNHCNTIGAKITEDTPIYLHLIPNSRVPISDDLLTRLMDLSEANKAHGTKLAMEKKNLRRLKSEVESGNVRRGDVQVNKSVDDVRDPNMETEK